MSDALAKPRSKLDLATFRQPACCLYIPQVNPEAPNHVAQEVVLQIMSNSHCTFRNGYSRNGALALLLLASLFIAFTVTGTPAMAIEEPKFTVSLHEGDIEIRDYQAAVAAEVTVTGDQNDAANKGFRLLAGYIFGGNKRHQSIAMTAPVTQQPVGEQIAMTAPVTQTASNGAWVVRFTMPSKYSLATLPEPNDLRITLRNVAPARFAVIRFSGIAGSANVVARTAELMAFVQAHRQHAIGPVSLAQYDPPWTLWFMRRNEVMIQLVQ